MNAYCQIGLAPTSLFGGFRLFGLCLAAYLVLAITIELPGTPTWYDQQRIGQVVLFAMAAFLACLSPFRLYPLRWPFLIALGAALIAIARAVQLKWALVEVAMFLGLATIGVMTARWLQDPTEQNERSRFLEYTVLATVLAYLVGRVAAYTAIVVTHAGVYAWEFFNGFTNVRFFGQFQTLTIPLLAAYVLCGDQVRLKQVALVVTLIAWCALCWLSGTRGTWLGVAVACGLLSCLATTGRRLAVVIVLALIAGYLLYWFAFDILPTLWGLKTSLIKRNITSSSGRNLLWEHAFRLIVKSPLFGIGPMGFSAMGDPKGAHPHNSWLQIAVEWGLPIACFASWLLGRWLWRAARVLRAMHRPNELALGLFAAVSGAFVQSLVDGVLVIPYTQTLLAVEMGWLAGLLAHSSSTGESSAGSHFSVGLEHMLKLVLLASMAGLLWFSASSLGSLEVEINRQLADYHILRPRYWSAGRIR